MRLLLDENFDNDILRGLLRHKPDLDFARAQDVPEILSAPDPVLLEWAANEGRILLTHDVQTITKHAYERVANGQPMPGVFEVKSGTALGPIIEDLLLLIEASKEGEWEGQVRYLSLR